MGTQATQSEMRDWYIKVFGATATQGTPNFITASLPGVGTYYLDPRDDILVVVQAFDVEVAAEALTAVP